MPRIRPTISLTIDEDLRDWYRERPEINMSELVRGWLRRYKDAHEGAV